MARYLTKYPYPRSVCEHVLTKMMVKNTLYSVERLERHLSVSYSCKVVAVERSYSSEPVRITAHLDEDFSSL